MFASSSVSERDFKTQPRGHRRLGLNDAAIAGVLTGGISRQARIPELVVVHCASRVSQVLHIENQLGPARTNLRRYDPGGADTRVKDPGSAPRSTARSSEEQNARAIRGKFAEGSAAGSNHRCPDCEAVSEGTRPVRFQYVRAIIGQEAGGVLPRS